MMNLLTTKIEEYYKQKICPSCKNYNTSNCKQKIKNKNIVQKNENNTTVTICNNYIRQEEFREPIKKHISTKPTKYIRKNYSEV